MAKPGSRNSGRSGGSSIFTGVMIGLIVGAVLAVGVALWATGLNPFKSTEPAAGKPAPAARAKPDPAPSFDFYKVLPSDRPGELPATVTPRAPAPRYYLQAGAFRSPADADNLKAQLALLGVEAVIQTSEVAGKGVFHRVRVGPYLAVAEANHTRSLLTQNNIPTTLVKEIPTTQETP
ncbi:MAG: SPOR domain-containing protein [Thiobacillus sp.]|jgi:cell division protein FtsN|uniref:SPOR domain-containing protein n=1 Tax=Thiobacillus sp. TaxID=924 RepID=UPI0028946A2A|nr:SPOR domain-containing protein [Thiobacillus sp.]MDT3706046.1 SPOR domain-containing protein [Thiobacillus sp.]